VSGKIQNSYKYELIRALDETKLRTLHLKVWSLSAMGVFLDGFDLFIIIETAEKRYISVHPINRLGTPDEIAHSVLFLCDDKVSFMTGAMMSIDGGLSAK